MGWVIRTLSSSLGAKYIMAITGLGLVGFIVAHLSGNFLLFAGEEAFDAYAEFLHSKPALIWTMRLGLLAITVLHIGSAIRLTKLNSEARPSKYVAEKSLAVGFAGRTMIWSGLIIAAFMVYHIAHYTLMIVGAESSALGRAGEKYKMVVAGFSQVPVSAFYIIAMALLCMHLSHGVSSLFQSLGLHHPKYNKFIKLIAPVFAGIMFVGFSSIPLSVLLGIVK